MPKTRSQKETMVNNLSDRLKTARALVFANYQGLTMSQLSQIRDNLASQNAKFNITKNSLLKLALKNVNLNPVGDQVDEGPTATLMAFEDEITPIKTLVKALKDAQIGSIKAGFLGTEYLTGSAITRLSQLPSKQELRTQVVGLTVAPLKGIVTILQGNLRNLVFALDQIRAQKGGE